MKKLQTIALAGALLLGGCHTTNKPLVQNPEPRTTQAQGSGPEKKQYVPKTPLDKSLKIISDARQKELNVSDVNTPQTISWGPSDLSEWEEHSYDWRVDMRSVFEDMAQRYYGLEPQEREKLLFNDLYETKSELAIYELQEQESQIQRTEQITDLEQKVNRLQRTVNFLERTNGRINREKERYEKLANTKEVEIIQEPCYEPQIIPQESSYPGKHPIDENEVAIRIGDHYVVMPEAGLICPPQGSDEKACLSVRDIISRFSEESRAYD